MIAGEYGITLQIRTGQDLTGHTGEALVIRQPDGTRVSRTPTVATPPTEGILTYSTQALDFPIPGVYQIQAQVAIGVGPQRLMRSAPTDLPVAHAL